MTTRSSLRRAAIAAAAAGLAIAFGAIAYAQTPPAAHFGAGLEPGAEVEAFANGTSCGKTEVTAEGEWAIIIGTNAPCSPKNGDTVTFTLDGQTVEEQESWSPGDAPANLATGMTLTPTGESTPKPKPSPAGTDGVISGELPREGFSLVKFGGSIQELRSELASKCTSGAPIFTTANGVFVPYFPTAKLSSPNAAFEAVFPGGIPSETALLAGNCG